VKALSKLALGLSLLFSSPALAAEPVFVALAEGFTSKGKEVGIEVGQRMFSIPTFPAVCAGLQAPARLVVVAPKPLQLVRGQWFSYKRLVVLALDAAGRILPPVPIAVEVEEVTPPLLNLRSDMTADPNGKVLPIRKGSFQFRFTAICEGHSAFAVARAEVVEP